MTTLAEHLAAQDDTGSGKHPCDNCGNPNHAFALVQHSEQWICGHCITDMAREAAGEVVDEDTSWASELGSTLRAQRNMILDSIAWTFRADSPLTPACQAEWLAYAGLLNRMTVNAEPLTWTWPVQPTNQY